MFKEMTDKSAKQDGEYIINKNMKYLFLGDYVNRGR